MGPEEYDYDMKMLTLDHMSGGKTQLHTVSNCQSCLKQQTQRIIIRAENKIESNTLAHYEEYQRVQRKRLQ